MLLGVVHTPPHPSDTVGNPTWKGMWGWMATVLSHKCCGRRLVKFSPAFFTSYLLEKRASIFSRNHYIIPCCCPCAVFNIESKFVRVSVLRIGIVYCLFQIFSFGTCFFIMHMGESSNLAVILTGSWIILYVYMYINGDCSVKTLSSLNKKRFPQNTTEEIINKNWNETAKTQCTTSLILTNKFSPTTPWYEQRAPPEPGTPHPKTKTKPRK